MDKSQHDKLASILESDAKYINKKVDLKEISGKHIIITGASGLIGINLLASLKEFSKTHSKELPKITAIFRDNVPNYLKPIFSFKNLKIKNGDVTEKKFVDSLEKADYIIHAAGYGQPGRFMQDKIKTFKINTEATISLLQKLKPKGKFIFISTSEI